MYFGELSVIKLLSFQRIARAKAGIHNALSISYEKQIS